MMTEEEKKRIIESAFNTGICIDDEFAEPYSDEGNKDMPKTLLKSFEDEANCSLEIVKYENYKTFSSRNLLNNKDIVILDWELSNDPQKVYDDALKIIGDCTKEKSIKVVCIYTTEEDVKKILKYILAYHAKIVRDEDMYKSLKEKLDDHFSENGSEFTVDEFEIFVKKYLADYIFLNKERKKKVLDDFKAKLKQKFEQKNLGSLCKLLNEFIKANEIGSTENLYTWFSYYCNSYGISDKKGAFSNWKVINDVDLFLGNTLIIPISKPNVRGSGINPAYLFDKILSSVQSLPNYRTFLFTSMIRTPIYKGLSTISRGLMGVDEAAIIQHANKYHNDNDLLNYIATVFGMEIKEILKDNTDLKKVSEIFRDVENSNCDDSETKKLISLLTFRPSEAFRFISKDIETGDIFEVENDITNTFMGKYILCISQECDCLNPRKINFNFAFAIGEVDKDKNVLQKVETEFLTFLPKDIVIKWSDRFLTINLKNHTKIHSNKEIEIDFGAEKQCKIKYLGNFKDFYSHRVAINAFSHAMRIGVDLPHKE